MTIWRQLWPVKTITSGGSSGPNPTDSFSIAMRLPDTNIAPIDTTSFAGRLGLVDSIIVPTDSLRINIGIYAESNIAPAETRTSAGYFWLSSTTGTASNTTTPANANSTNDGVQATAKTVLTGATVAALTSAVGINIPANTPVNAAIYRGWFSFVAGAGSTTAVILRSSSALFADITMHTSTTAFSFSNGTFTFNLIAAGVNTLDRLQSCQVIHQVTDTAAGTGGTLSVDAGRIELTNII